MKNAIIEYILSRNIKPNLKGFNYLVSAIWIALAADNRMPVGAVYKEVAKQYDTTWSCVERCIRNCLELAYPEGYKPSNGEFIARAVVALKYSSSTSVM